MDVLAYLKREYNPESNTMKENICCLLILSLVVREMMTTCHHGLVLLRALHGLGTGSQNVTPDRNGLRSKYIT